MISVESIICVLFAAIGLMLSCAAAHAEPVSMPKEPFNIGNSNPVIFDHSLHRKLEIPCGECHHDRDHNPRPVSNILSFSDGNVLRCRNCHNNEFENTYLQTRKDIFHINCRTCHAVGFEGNRGPRKCKACHIEKNVTN